MYPVHAQARQIESDWARELAEYFGRTPEDLLTEKRPWFEFPPGALRVELMDGSFAQFAYAFFIASEAKRAIAVFTEHCGHHVFPYHGAKILRDGSLVYEQQRAA